jgi:cell fate (sporulation/competence/biofilm development) regulator YlbF (YheA/YmcA/DUF963 family)
MSNPTPHTNVLTAELTTATEKLAKALAATPPIANYHQAQARLESEPAALALLQSLLASQEQLRQKQMNGGVRQADLNYLRALQEQVQSNTLIMDFVQAQQDMLAYLPQVNQTISEYLGIDFAALSSGSD